MHYYATYVRKESCQDYALTLQQLRHVKTRKEIVFACVCRGAIGEQQQDVSVVEKLRNWFLQEIETHGINWNKGGMQPKVYQILEKLSQSNGGEVLALAGILTLDDQAILFGKNGCIQILNRRYGIVHREQWKCCPDAIRVENVILEKGVGLLCHTEGGQIELPNLWQSLNPEQMKTEEQLQVRFREWMEYVAPFCAAVYLVSV